MLILDQVSVGQIYTEKHVKIILIYRERKWKNKKKKKSKWRLVLHSLWTTPRNYFQKRSEQSLKLFSDLLIAKPAINSQSKQPNIFIVETPINYFNFNYIKRATFEQKCLNLNRSPCVRNIPALKKHVCLFFDNNSRVMGNSPLLLNSWKCILGFDCVWRVWQCNRHGHSSHRVLEMWGYQYHSTAQHPVHTVKCAVYITIQFFFLQ